MALNTAAITAGIAALSISGLTIKDMTGIPDSVAPRDLPIMFPEPAELSSTESGEPLTFGVATAYWRPQRTLIYTYLHALVGTGRALKDFYAPMTVKQDALFEAIVEMDVSGVDVVGVSFSRMGVLEDASGLQAYGFFVNVVVSEKVNA